MKRVSKRTKNILIILSILIPLSIIAYFGLSQNIISSSTCSYVDARNPDRDYGTNTWNCDRMWDASYQREIYFKIDLPNNLIDRINNREVKITSVSLNELIPSEYQNRNGVTKIGIYATVNDWYTHNLTYNNKPSKEFKIGEVWKGVKTSPSSQRDTNEYYSTNFNDNLLDHIINNINNNESEISLIFTQESEHDNNFGINKLGINYELEESKEYYSLIDNVCIKTRLFSNEVKPNDYNDLSTCEENINPYTTPIIEDNQESKLSIVVIIMISSIVMLVILIFFIILNKKNRKK